MSPIAPLPEAGERLRDFVGVVRASRRQAFREPMSRYAVAWKRRTQHLLGGALLAFLLAMVWAIPSGSLGVGLGRFGAVALVYALLWRVLRYGGPLDRRRWKRARLRWEQHAEEPWTVDHRWDRRGELRRNEASRKLKRGASGTAWLVGWLVYTASGGALPGWLLLPVAFMITVRATQFWRVWGRGDLRLSFTRFPYHPGEPAEIHLGITPRGPEVLAARYRLYRFEERFLLSGRDVAWRATHVARPLAEDRALLSEHADVRLVFDIPADAGGTCLSARLPSYWELQVELWTKSGSMLESFLVPVYDRAADAQDPTSGATPSAAC